jgi:hypothetical protein
LSWIINAGSDHTPYKLMDNSLFGFHRWNSPMVESSVVGVGWALPTISRWDQRYLVGTAHPTIRKFRNVRDNSIYSPDSSQFAHYSEILTLILVKSLQGFTHQVGAGGKTVYLGQGHIIRDGGHAAVGAREQPFRINICHCGPDGGGHLIR